MSRQGTVSTHRDRFVELHWGEMRTFQALVRRGVENTLGRGLALILSD